MRPGAAYIHPKAGAHQVKHILVRQRMRHEQKSWHPEKTRVECGTGLRILGRLHAER